MLPTLSVARRYRLKCGYQIPFRIKLGMIFSTFEECAGDAVSIFGNSGTDLNCRRVLGVAHEKSIAWNLTWVCPSSVYQACGHPWMTLDRDYIHNVFP